MKKVFAIAVAAALLVGITALAYGKAPKPKKATGGVQVTATVDWHVSFNAHEGSGAKPAKGVLNLWRADGARRFRFDVQTVRVNETADEAYFAGPCTYDSAGVKDVTPDWFYVYIKDAGSPGAGADEIGWDWPESQAAAQTSVKDGDKPDITTTINSGNLVVHY